MRGTIFLGCAATLALTPLALAGATPDARAWCHKPGEPCSKLKRAADAAAEALAYAAPGPLPEADEAAWNECHRPGAACAVARREALALNEAAADALAVAGGADASADASNADTPDADAAAPELARRGEREDQKNRFKSAGDILRFMGYSPGKMDDAGRNNWCHKVAEPCSKVKRAAAAVAAALAEPAPEAADAAEADAQTACHGEGEPCDLAKRGLAHLEAAIMAI